MKKAAKLTNRRVAARKVLTGAIPFVGKDVIVISKNRAGERYLATSMPSRSSQDFAATIAMVADALKALKRYHQNQLRVEKHCEADQAPASA